MKKFNVFLAIVFFVITSCSKDFVADETMTSLGQMTLKSSPAGDVVGKTVVGYQGWFACANDGQPGGTNWWWHWSSDWNQLPSNSTKCLWAWPDVRDYTTTYQTGYSNLNNGSPAILYSCVDQQTVDVQFQWMQENGIDCAALQRFNPTGAEGPLRDLITQRVRTAAEATGRKFYIMYDPNNWTNMQSEMKTDWTNKMSTYTSSSAYATQNGKPVIAIWGFGYNDSDHPWSASVCLDVINWFKGQGCYVIGGVPREWRYGTGGSRSGFSGVYHAFDMISPWLVGAINNVGDADNIYNTYMVGDQADCDANGMDYQPCVLPGGLSHRAHGDLMWRMFYNAVRVGCQSIYISMYDEYNEGHQIAKTAPTQAFIPAGSGYNSLDYDGTYCTSDYYLRLTRDGNRMLKGEVSLTSTRFTKPGVDYMEYCDATSGWGSHSSLSISTSNKKEGTGSLQAVGSGTDEFTKVISPAFNSGASASTGKLQFWYYVSDVSKLNAENQIEIGSDGGPDSDEYSWSIGSLHNGWNLITKSFSDAWVIGNPNLNAINWIRIYHFKNGSVTTGIDGVQIIP